MVGVAVIRFADVQVSARAGLVAHMWPIGRCDADAHGGHEVSDLGYQGLRSVARGFASPTPDLGFKRRGHLG